MIEGADKYVTKSSMWLIFTEEKRWVIEFTNTKTLWFNYNLFHSELKLLSMDCVESKDIIKEWFESRFLEKEISHVTDTSNMPYLIVENVVRNGVKDTKDSLLGSKLQVEDTIQNGVKHTLDRLNRATAKVEDTIQNGVKDTEQRISNMRNRVDNTLQNGVKESKPILEKNKLYVNKAIQNGVKNTEPHVFLSVFVVENAIQNGVKEIDGDSSPLENIVEDTIQNGVKDVLGWNFNMRQDNVEDTIENGVKQVKSDKGYMNHFKQIYRAEQTIENGVKDTGARHLRVGRKVKDVIQNGVKVMMSGSEWYHQDEVNTLIEKKIKEDKN
jgi:hypothetical protein